MLRTNLERIKQFGRTTLGVALLVLTIATQTLPAHAQTVDGPNLIVNTISAIKGSISAAQMLIRYADDKTKDALVNAAASAAISGINYFVSQLAYQAAVALTSECPGQQPCWNSKQFGQIVKEAAIGAAGDAIGTLSEEGGFEKLGLNLCAPPSIPSLPGLPNLPGFDGAQFTLNLQLGMLDELKPPAPKCDFNQIASNWTSVRDSLSSKQLLGQVKSFFEPGQSPLYNALSIRNAINIDISKTAASDAGALAQIDASAGGGFSGIIDPISKRIKAPPSVTAETYKFQQYLQKQLPLSTSTDLSAGQIASKAVATVVPNALGVFGQTLLSRLWNKLSDGLLSAEELIAAQPDIILNEDGIVQPAGVVASRIAQSLILSSVTSTPRDIGLIDPMLDFTTCPTSRGLKNCVVDAQLANAVNVASATPLTIRAALDQNFLHGDWPLIPAKNRAKDQDPFCFTSSYCESNLKKLRAARVISIGWEIAAAKSPIDKPIKLRQVVDAFNDCNPDTGLPDADHPWCHLIDPDWVLKLPLTQCRAQVFGPLLADPTISNRSETCTDAPTCLRQDDRGQCTGGWGYCTREKNIWRFNGDTCPEQYNSCRTMTNAQGAQVSLLTNTIQFGICNADNVGCEQYSTEENIGSANNATNPTDDWKVSTAQFFNQKVENCKSTDAGCTTLFNLGATRSLNLIRNGSFERLVDGDLDNSADHAEFWYPLGEVPEKANGAISREAGNATDGIVSLELTDENTDPTSCALSAGNACDQESGCTCKSGGYSCKIAFGEKECQIIRTVSQDGIAMKSNNPYSLSASFTTQGSKGNGALILTAISDENEPIKLGSDDVSIVAGQESNCRVNPSGQIELSITGTTAVLRPVCNFFFTNTQRSNIHARLDITGEQVFVDSVQLEEGNPTAFHDGYGALPPIVNAKVAPEYLGCKGEASDPTKCGQYAPVCKSSEVGCESFAPKNGDPSIPAIISNADRCPSECVGYDAFRQEATAFSQQKFPVNFIPSTAAACTASEVGCTEFTNVATEARAYFSELRACQKPDAPDTATYYSWEGSDTTGFQLRVWSFKRSNILSAHSVNGSDIAPTANAVNAGNAPCTAFNAQDGSCTDSAVGNPAVCNRVSIDAGDFDCREFYDVDGNRHYRRLSKVVLAVQDCENFRITTSTQQDCSASGGKWDPTKSQCSYATALSETVSCRPAANNCRAFKGGSSGTAQDIVFDDFESSITGWGVVPGVEQSPESVIVGGHSLKIPRTMIRGERDIKGKVALNRSYTLTFFARGSGPITTKIDSGKNTPGFNFSDSSDSTPAVQINLTTQWRKYEVGPVIIGDPTFFTKPNIFLTFEANGTGDTFIDNVQLREVRDSFFLIADSFRTPDSCNRTLTGVPSPQEMIGCKAYQTSTGRNEFLKSFGNICRQEAIGCTAYGLTQNTPQNFYAETFNAVCKLQTACTGTTACPCNYEERGPEFKQKIIQPDVCRVAVGQTSCLFNLNRAFLPADLRDSQSLDVIEVPADAKKYLVIREQDKCDTTAASCTEMGKHVSAFEKQCSLTANGQPATCNANSCTCNDSISGGSCQMIRGESSCTISFNQPVTIGWETTFKKNDPSKYNQTLCESAALGCSAFATSNGQQFFKFNPKQTCEFREAVTAEGGATRSGWFRTTSTGAVVPCEPALLKNGDFFDIPKNGDQIYKGFVGLCQQQFDRCEEFIDPLDTSGSNPKGKAYYYIDNDKLNTKDCGSTVSLKEGCVLFDRTSNLQKTFSSSATYLKSETQRDGTQAAPQNCDSTNRDGACEKRCSAIKNGVCENSGDACHSDAQCNPNGSEECIGDRYFAAGCFADTDCNQAIGESCIAQANGSNDFTKNDTNIIIKVIPDRECGQWYACSAEQTVFDTQQNKWRTVCTGFDLCEESRQNGQTSECTKWVDPPKNILTPEAYTARDVTWNGQEYSGYSIVNKYIASLVKPIQVQVTVQNNVKNVLFGRAQSGQRISSTRFAVLLDPADSCNNNSECEADETGEGGTCINKLCYYDLTGGPIDTDDSTNVASCRAYPETDAPFTKTILRDPTKAGKGIEKLISFKGANTCGEKFDPANPQTAEACECSYKRLTFGGGGGEKFVALDNNETERGICVGGPTPGENCDPANGNLTDPENAGAKCDDGGRGGSCAELESKSTAVGWQGLCLDYDQSISVNGDPNKFACNLWMPVDQIAGAQDVFNQFRSAGFDVDSPLVYCAASAGGKGNIVSTSCAPIAGTETPYADVIHNESCANITTLLDDNTEIGHLNDQYWFFSPSVGSFSRRHTEPVGVAERDIVGVKIEFIDHAMPRGVKNAEDVVRPFATAYLFPSSDNAKDWKRTVSWTTNDRSSGSPKLGIGNAIIDPSNGSVLGDSVPDAQCMSLLDMSNSDGESECDKINDNKICIAMRGNTQNGQLNSIHAAFCDAGRGGGGAKRHFVRVQVTLLRREACTVLSNVHLGATDDFASAPWTDRLLNDNATDLPGFITSSGGKYNREDVTSRPNVSSDITPFGHGQTNGDISAIAGKQTFPVFGTEGGSNFTTVTISGGDYLEQSGNTNAGYTYACDGGGCDQIGTTSGGFDATKAAGENRLKELFAVSWFNFEAASGQTYTKVGTATTPAWDHRKDFNTPDVAPQVRGVDIFNCLADGGCLERAQPGITINSTSTGSVEGEGGRLKATIRYYGYANKDHMPIRRLMIDFDGNGHTAAGQSKVIATSGFYRNHRGVKEVQGKLTPICGATETEWGKTPQSCDTFFFEQTKTYLCSNALLEQLPLCGTAGYPCRRADTCVYKPKVQIMDNWAMCNGNCGGEACMNSKLGVDDIAGCDKLNPNAWTPFAGEIIVRP